MSRRFVATAASAMIMAGIATCGAAFAQNAPYGYDSYGYAYGGGDSSSPGFYADPGNGGASAYQPFRYDRGRDALNYPVNRPRYAYPSAPYYVDPYDGGRATALAPSDYDLRADERRTMVEVPNSTNQPPGTIVIDTASRHLYLTERNGNALRYGIGVGREGFAWKGVAKVERKAEWPAWIPPSEMVKRRPDLPDRMEGGIENPLGARALYLFKGSRDTLFRIHGTNEPDTIGKAVSSGCIRMMNSDVIDLYQRVPVGTKVVVL